MCESVWVLNYLMLSPSLVVSADERTAQANALLGLSQKANPGWCRALIARGSDLSEERRGILLISITSAVLANETCCIGRKGCCPF